MRIYDAKKAIPNFGPWMLSKKSFRKRKKGSSPSKVSKSHAPSERMGHVEKEGSRFEILSHEMQEPGRDSNPEVNSVNKGKKEGGPLLGSERNMDVGKIQVGLPSSTKVRNLSGGKNPQFGPRLRDAKKAARAAGPYTKPSLVAKGPEGSKGKGTWAPSVVEAVRNIYSSNLTIDKNIGVGVLQKSPLKQTEVSNTSRWGIMEDPNPLPGFVQNVKGLEQSPMVCEITPKGSEAVKVQLASKLSELNSKASS